MANQNLFIVFLLFSTIYNIETHELEVENEHPFTYSKGAHNGPKNWGRLNRKWELCQTGKLQSPIDLHDQRVKVTPQLGQLRRTYKPAPAILRNRGHDISVMWKGDAGGIRISHNLYKLQQCHWHTPSEHTINGTRYKMELHMVHNNSRGQIAVAGILYKFGRPDPFLQKLLDHIKSVDEKGIDLGIVDPWGLKFGSRKYYRYLGSLTVPPCTEGVIWTILKKVRTVSREQVRALRNAVHDGFKENARPSQAFEGRTVFMYRPQSSQT